MTDSKKAIIKKIIEIAISFIVGAAVATGVINYDKIVKAASAGESVKIEQQVQAYSDETVKDVTVSTVETVKK